MLRVLEVEVKALGLGPSFDVRDLTDNALSVLDRFFGVVTVLDYCLAGSLVTVLGPRTGAQAPVDSATSFTFHGGTLTFASSSCFCETSLT